MKENLLYSGNFINLSDSIEKFIEMSKHIKDIKNKGSVIEKLEIYKFYIYTQTILEEKGLNINPVYFSIEELKFLLEYMKKGRVIRSKIKSMLQSQERETVSLGLALLKNERREK